MKLQCYVLVDRNAKEFLPTVPFIVSSETELVRYLFGLFRDQFEIASEYDVIQRAYYDTSDRTFHNHDEKYDKDFTYSVLDLLNKYSKGSV